MEYICVLLLILWTYAIAHEGNNEEKDRILKHLEGRYENHAKRTSADFAAYRNGKVRLVDGPNEWTGRVEILFDGVWGTVCDDFWEDRDARVVCRQLGYPGGEAWSLAEFGEGSGAIHLDNVECTGEEPGLSFCPQAEELDDYLNCGHYEDAGVECEEPNPQEGDVRLRGGPSWMKGRVEIYHDGQWGTVCDDRFDRAEARVTCWNLGLRGGRAFINMEYGEGTGPIWIDEIDCEGYEYYLTRCRRADWGVTNCYHYEDAGVTCNA